MSQVASGFLSPGSPPPLPISLQPSPCTRCQPVLLQLLVMTVFTVGYGDFVPHSHGGRIITIIAGVGGVFLLAVAISTTANFLRLTRSESKVRAWMHVNG